METKPCRSCCEEINANAKKCPRCQAVQSIWWAGNGIIPFTIVFVLFLSFSFVPLWQLRQDREERNIKFADVQQSLKVSDVRLVFDPPPKPQEGVEVLFETFDAWLYCTIHNDSEQDWSSFDLFVEFRDANGERIDINNVSEHATVRSHTQLDVRLQCRLAVDPAKVAETLVTITDASHDYY